MPTFSSPPDWWVELARDIDAACLEKYGQEEMDRFKRSYKEKHGKLPEGIKDPDEEEGSD